MAGVGDETGTGCDMTGGRNRIEGKRKQCVGDHLSKLVAQRNTRFANDDPIWGGRPVGQCGRVVEQDQE